MCACMSVGEALQLVAAVKWHHSRGATHSLRASAASFSPPYFASRDKEVFLLDTPSVDVLTYSLPSAGKFSPSAKWRRMHF